MKVFVIGGVVLPDSDVGYEAQKQLVDRTMQRLGADIVRTGHELVVCSPFPGSADVSAVRGAVAASKTRRKPPVIDIHYPEHPDIESKIDELDRDLRIRTHRYADRVPLDASGKIDPQYGWLLSQITAMERSQVTVGLGGRVGRAASLLFGVAQSRRKIVLPLAFLGGAASAAFQARRYELEDRLKKRIAVLQDSTQIDKVIGVLETIAGPARKDSRPDKKRVFFISYARTRPQEADFVEMTLRRRGLDVFRDEHDFGAGKKVQTEIIEHIHQAEVFVVIWCKEYACSPWCYDEFEIALKRHKAGSLSSLWILQVDETRIVPPAARELIYYQVESRNSLEGRLLWLLEQIAPPPEDADTKRGKRLTPKE
jgi:hypothetical protein